MQNYYNLIVKAIRSTLELNDDVEFTWETSLNAMGLDSMSSLEFLLELENLVAGFMINADNLTMEDLTTIKSVAKYIELQMSSVK